MPWQVKRRGIAADRRMHLRLAPRGERREARAGSASGAVAAYFAVKAQPGVIAEVFSWTGFYVGDNVGYAWGRGDINGRKADIG